MIPFETMGLMATRAFVIEELLETIYEAAKELEEETPSGELGSLAYRVRHLVHGASGLAGTLAHDLSDLMSQCPKEGETKPPTQLSELGLGDFAIRVLRTEGIQTVDSLTNMTALDLLKVPNLDQRTLAEIKVKLEAHGMALKAGDGA